MAGTYYHWDADDNVFEELDDQKQVTCTYTHAPGQYGELLSENRGGTIRHYHHDAQGSTTELTDDTGAVTDTFAYSAFGEHISRTGTTPTPYRWNGAWGYQYDEHLDSYYVRARVYKPTIARWISVDPLRFVDSFNLMIYSRNSPVILVDPSGLLCACETYYADMVAKSFIDGAAPFGAIVPDRSIGTTAVAGLAALGAILIPVLGPGVIPPLVGIAALGTATERLEAFGTFVDSTWPFSLAFNQDPQNDAKDKTYRLYTRVRVRFRCCGNDINISSVTKDMDGGVEIPPIGGLSAVEGSIYLSPFSQTSSPPDTEVFSWRGWGAPNSLVEPGMQLVAWRTSTNIWHKPEVWLNCGGSHGYYSVKNFSGSRFPSHRLWINGVEVDELQQGTFSDLWKSDLTDPSFVR